MRMKRDRMGAGTACAVMVGLLALTIGMGSGQGAAAEPVVLYQTSFEVEEGYAAADEGIPLWEQGMGWLAEGSGGSGVVTNYFEGYGQQGFLGYWPPAPKDDLFTVWRPIDVAAPPRGYSVVRFATLMEVVDSDNHRYDDFRWSVYNTDANRLFTLDFDNSRTNIFYALDDNGPFRHTGFSFSNDVMFLLEIYMDFARNTWRAIIDGQVIVDAQPITTTKARLDLSDVDAVWQVREPGYPGNNYLLFDDYSITAEPMPPKPPTLEVIGYDPDFGFDLMVKGQRGVNYTIEVADQPGGEWFPLQTNAPPEGVWWFLDESAAGYPMGIYRARQIGQ